MPFWSAKGQGRSRGQAESVFVKDLSLTLSTEDFRQHERHSACSFTITTWVVLHTLLNRSLSTTDVISFII